MTKIQKLEIVGHEPKEWETPAKDGFGKGRILPFFLQKKGRYEVHTWKEETDDSVKTLYEIHKVFKGSGRQSVFMYKEIIDQLESGGTILIDEDILKLV